MNVRSPLLLMLMVSFLPFLQSHRSIQAHFREGGVDNYFKKKVDTVSWIGACVIHMACIIVAKILGAFTIPHGPL